MKCIVPKRQRKAPILNALKRYADSVNDRFHTPGHKGGKGAHPLLRQLAGEMALNLDLGLAGNLDSLQEPKSWIAQAQNLAAELYGADSSFFLINGSTCGVQAMIMGVAGRGEKIIISRNAHRSVAGAIVLSGSKPVFVRPEFDDDLQIPVGVSAIEVERLIIKHPDAKAIFITNPTYHGIATDLVRIVDYAHARGISVLVDEAHGPHLKFCDQLPISAVDAGADLCVQSTHKLLGSLSQCSILHCKGTRIDTGRIKSMLNILQSTSPSYLLLASLDIARLQMATQGIDLIARTVHLANQVRAEINAIEHLYCFGDEKVGSPGIFAYDPTKLTITINKLSLTGFQIERILREQYGIQPELSDFSNFLLFITLGNRRRDIERLVTALKKLAKRYKNDSIQPSNGEAYPYPFHVEQEMSPREAVFSRKRRVTLDLALGEISAEVLTFYPPGIPIVWPGERINEAVVAYSRWAVAAGARLVGLSDTAVRSIDVVW